MRAVIDIDGVLANFNEAYCKLIIKESGENKFPIDWEYAIKENQTFPPCWNYPEFYGYDKGWIHNHIWKKCIGFDDSFWFSLDPLPGAEIALDKLNGMSYDGDDIYFLTSRPGYKSKIQTEQWLLAYGMDYPTVIMCDKFEDKIPFLRTHKINLFIDDKIETVQQAIKETFVDRVYLKDAPYNRGVWSQEIRVASSIMDMFEQEGI